MTTMDGKEMVRGLYKTLEALDEVISWVVCPMCREEWNKLHRCVFWRGPENHRKLEETNMCVCCAETVLSLSKIRDLYPIEGVKISQERFKHFYRCELNLPKTFYTRIKYGETKFTIEPVANGLIIYDPKDRNGSRFFDNIMAVWMFVKDTLENPVTADQENW